MPSWKTELEFQSAKIQTEAWWSWEEQSLKEYIISSVKGGG